MTIASLLCSYTVMFISSESASGVTHLIGPLSYRRCGKLKRFTNVRHKDITFMPSMAKNSLSLVIESVTVLPESIFDFFSEKC